MSVETRGKSNPDTKTDFQAADRGNWFTTFTVHIVPANTDLIMTTGLSEGAISCWFKETRKTQVDEGHELSMTENEARAIKVECKTCGKKLRRDNMRDHVKQPAFDKLNSFR